MKKYSKLSEVRLSNITPLGWAEKTLKKELCGTIGHLHEISYPFDKGCWKMKKIEGRGLENWWPYEQDGYRIDAIIRCASLLDDTDTLFTLVGDDIEKSLETDDFIGPEELKKDGDCARWAHAVYFRALYAMWSKTGDETYLEKMRKHYLTDESSYEKGRNVVNVETMLRLYEYFDDEALLCKAIKAFEGYQNCEISREKLSDLSGNTTIRDHGVTFNEIAKISAIMYIYTGKKEYIDAAKTAYEKIEKFHMLPDGVNSSRENLSCNESYKLHESCDITDYCWSMGYLLEATGDGKYADRIERAIFNAFFGATMTDFRAFQYYSGVNQVIATRNSTHDMGHLNTNRMQFSPYHFPECCAANIGRAFPNYVLRMYHTAEDAIALTLYGDSEYSDENITIIQSGNYPYGFKTNLDVTLRNDKVKKLLLRIPAWSCGCKILVDGTEADYDTINGFAHIKVLSNCKIEILFKPTFDANTSGDGGIYYTYGPFLLSLKIDENVSICTEEKNATKNFPAFNIEPASAWNYAVSGYETPEIIINEVKDEPLWNYIPFEIKIKAHRFLNWRLFECDEALRQTLLDGHGFGEAQIKMGAPIISGYSLFTPSLPGDDFIAKNIGDEEEITLVPYGCTNIRLTVFPKHKVFIYG